MIDVVDKNRQGTDTEREQGDQRQRASDEDYVFCAMCSAVLARRTDRTEINGSHEHTCTNPHGYTFHLGCYAEAPGCSISGQPMAADSWFAGFRWRLATCSNCDNHLGWYFQSQAEQYFYGLILNRIQIENP